MHLRIGVIAVSQLVLLSAIVAAVCGSRERRQGKDALRQSVHPLPWCGWKGKGEMTFTPPVADLTAPAAQTKLDATLLKTIHDGRRIRRWGPGSLSCRKKKCVM